MPRVRKSIQITPRASFGSGKRARLYVALCLILPPALLLWRACFVDSLLPAHLLSSMPPWNALHASLPSPFWNALIWDSLGQYYPWRAFAAQAFHAGHIPLWNPYQFCGAPFLANAQSALFYPLNIFFWTIDARRAFGLSALLHLVLGGWFAYLFLRAIRLGRFGAAVGGAAFALNGYFLTWLYLPTVMASAIWLPLALLFGEKYYRRGKLYFAAAAGAAVALSALAGHPQIFLMCSFFFACYFLLRGLLLRQFMRLLLGGVCAGAFALLLAGVQLLPLVELIRLSHRTATPGPEGYKFYLDWALPWQNLTSLLAPDFFGNPALGTYWGKGNYAEVCAYAGIIPLALAGLAAVFCKRFAARFFAISAVIWLLCAFGTPVNWPVFHFIPGMNRAGSPARLLLLYLSSIAFLSGMGADWLAKALAARPTEWVKKRLLITILIATVFAVSMAFLTKAMLPPLDELSVNEAFADARFNFTLLAAFSLVSVVLIFLLEKFSKKMRLLAAVIVMLMVIGDLLCFGFRYLRLSPKEEVYPAPGVVQFLQQHANQGRFLALSPAPLEKSWPASDMPQAIYLLRSEPGETRRLFPKALLPPNSAMVYSLRDILGYDSLYLANYRTLLGKLEGRDPSPPANGNLLLADSARRDMLKLFGVRYLVSEAPLEGKNLRLIYDREAKVYEVLPAYSRVWATAGAFDPAASIGSAAIVADEISQVRIEVNLPGPGKLVLADTLFPGWHAEADGKELSIELANEAFRAVALPAGKHQVDFSYRPAAFKVGLFAFLSALAISAGWLTSAAFSRKKK